MTDASIRRRSFITLLGGAAAAWPLAARGQQAAMPVVGYLYPGVPEAGATVTAAFRKGLSEAGFVEGRNVTVEYRWAQNDNARLPELAADLVRRRVAVIVVRGTVTARAAKEATATTPIVFGSGGDPVEAGLVASINRPGGNVTGAVSMSGELGSKWLGLLHELVPRAARFAVLITPGTFASSVSNIRAAAAVIGGQIEIFNTATPLAIDAAFARLVQDRFDALIVTPQTLFLDRRLQIVTLAAHHRLPTIYPFREFVEVGALMVYGSNLGERDRQVGLYTGRILKGEKPADLPIVRSTKFELIINRQTARTLGIEVPPTLLALADEVIE
jgi:putative ABC transport system substrate-binding protein